MSTENFNSSSNEDSTKYPQSFHEEKKKKYPSFNEVKYNWEKFKKSDKGYYVSNLYIKNTETKGLGVFTNRDIEEGEVIEYCHCIPIEFPLAWMRDRGIKKYAYWEKDHGVIALGYGSIYNSAERETLRNAGYFVFYEDQLIVFVAQRKIKKDEEILTWWGEGYFSHWCDPSKQSK